VSPEGGATVSHRYWDPKQLCLTEDQVEQHRHAGYNLQRINHLAAQHLIRIYRSYPDVNKRAPLIHGISTFRDYMNALIMGCEQIVEDALRQRPQRIIIHIHCKRTIDKTPEADEPKIFLSPNRALQVQVNTLLWLLAIITPSLIVADSALSGWIATALKKLTKALLRQRWHFDNLDATETSISVVVDDWDARQPETAPTGSTTEPLREANATGNDKCL
jgi:hypothetical protein